MNKECDGAPMVTRKGMFSELMPILVDRTIVMTISRLDAESICVTFIPQRNKESDDVALSTPLCLKGTPSELDGHLVDEVKGYVASHVTLASDLEQARKEMEEAVKRAREEARKRKGGATAVKPAEKSSPPAEPELNKEPTAKAPQPSSMSLFDLFASETTPSALDTGVPAAVAAITDVEASTSRDAESS
jgi:PRTRC genetic system protein E